MPSLMIARGPITSPRNAYQHSRDASCYDFRLPLYNSNCTSILLGGLDEWTPGVRILVEGGCFLVFARYG